MARTETLDMTEAIVNAYFISGDRPAFVIRSLQYLVPGGGGMYGVDGTDLTSTYGSALVTKTVNGWYDLYLPDGSYVWGWNGSTQRDNKAFADRIARLAVRQQTEGARMQRKVQRKRTLRDLEGRAIRR